jgi:hypothetical protein
MPNLKAGECLRGKRQKGRDRKIDVEKETEAQKGHRERSLLESDIQKIGIHKKV